MNDATAIMSETTSMTGHAIAGTPDYIAPEQITGKVVPASDIYSIGIVLYEMLTGIRPFSADNYMGVLMKQMYERPRPLRDLKPQISLALEDIVLQAMEKEAPKRFQQPNDLNQALLQAVSIQTGDSVITVSAWPTVAHAAFHRQQSGEQQPFVVSPTPVTPTAQTYNEAQRLTPPFGSQQSYTPSNPVSSAPITAGAKLVPTHKRRSPVALVAVGLLVALVLFGGLGTALLAPQVFGFGRHKAGKTVITTTTIVGNTPTSQGNTLITQKVPSTTTACPTQGTARAAVLAPLTPGSNQNLVYIVNEFNPLQATVKRREVNSKQGVEIVKMPNVTIGEAQVSQDGQWVLFTAHLTQQDQLRLVRVDGQGLQTLYCAPVSSSIFGSQWSFNQQSVVFDTGLNGQASTTMLLNIQSGDVQPELVPQGQFSYQPRTWLDATHVYLSSFPIQMRGTVLPQNLYLLDTQKGANQHDSDLQQVVARTQACGTFDTSYDSQNLYLSTCSSNGNATTSFNGPSTITIQDAKGGSAKTIFTSQTLAVTMIRAVSPTILLLMVENTAGNTSQNGLWKINIDGTGLTRLTTDTLHAQSLCQFSQYAWSNVSFDNNFYALQSYDASRQTYGMFYGSLNGGAPTQFAGISDGTQLFLSGWTRL